MSAICFLKKGAAKIHKFFIFLQGRYFVMGGPIDMMLACFERLMWTFATFATFPETYPK